MTQPLNRRLLALAVATALVGPVLAQETTPPLPADPSETDAATLDTITVTATRRAESAQSVPVSVSAVKGSKLDVIRSGGDDIRFLSARVPSLNVESSFGRTFPRFYIRGLGNTDFDYNSSQPVSLIYDEVVLENSVLKGFPAFDLDRIEVLRGPQGTLFGRNTPAGLVKFDSVRPNYERDGYARLSVATHGTVNMEGAVGNELGESLAGRASLLYQRRSDWVENTAPGNPPNDDLEGYEDLAFRGQLLFEPSQYFSGLLSYQVRRLEGTARLFRANVLAADGSGLVDDFDPDTVSIDGRNEQDLDVDGLNLRLTWDLGAVNLYSITSYHQADVFSRGDIDGGWGAGFLGPGNFGPGFIPFPAESGDGAEIEQFTQEFRLESNGGGALQWQAGLFWFDDQIKIDSYSYDTLFGGAANAFGQQRQDNTAWAVFGSLDYAVNDAFTLRGGLRYTEDEKEFVASRDFAAPFNADGGVAIAPIRVTPSTDDWSWDLSGSYKVSDNAHVYGRIAKGFRAPSIQGRLLFADARLPANQLVTVADSESVLSFEAGVKADIWDNRARVGVSVFRYTVEDQQLTAVGGGSNFNRLLNADQTNAHGIEWDVEAYLTDNLLVTFGSSWNHTEIDDPSLLVGTCFGNGAACLTRDPLEAGGSLARIDGNALPQAPEWIHNFTARWSTPMGESGEVFVYTDWAYRSEVNFFLDESDVFRGAPLLEGGLRIGYQWGFGEREIALYGRNILNEIEAVGGINFNNRTGFINEPRQWGVEFRANF